MAATPRKRGVEQEPWRHFWTLEKGQAARYGMRVSIAKQCANLAVMEEYSSICSGESMKTAQLEAMMQKNLPDQVEKLFSKGWFYPGVTQHSVMDQMPKNYWSHALALLRDIRNEALPKLAKIAPGGALRSDQTAPEIFATIANELWDEKESARVEQSRQRAAKAKSSDGVTAETPGTKGESSQATGIGSRGSKEIQPLDNNWEGPLWWPVFIMCCSIGPAPQSWCCAEASASSQVLFLGTRVCL